MVMTVTSAYFLLLLVLGMVIYYILPGRVQWIALLCMSVVFYCTAATPYTLAFPALSALIAWGVGLYLDRNRDKPEKSRAAAALAASGIIANTAVWFLLKGSSFWVILSGALHASNSGIPALQPLPIAAAMGMGYYTAQVIGYILDVLWGTVQAQRNPLKLFLFVVFFPQLTVGPISRYSQLEVLYGKHRFSYDNLCLGSQRILWGLFKKLVIADRVGMIVNGIWADPATYTGFWLWIAVLIYPLQIYADFSGCMDIILGSAELFDIHLAENFRNPFFARTAQEFWQRWHITLGEWARDYVYYPLLKSKRLVLLGKKARKRFGKKAGKLIPWTVAMAILWFVIGFWHGSVHHIVGVSLWFWSLLVLGEICAPVFSYMKEKLRVKTESFGWHLFQSARTYVIYALGCVLFTAEGLKEGLSRYGLLFHAFDKVNPWIFFDKSILKLGVTWEDVNLILLGVLLLFVVASLREKYNYARSWMQKQSIGFRWIAWIGLFLLVLIYGMYGPGYDASTFIYQGF